ncbi:hypothetical protein [Dyella telluris]|uniref:Uncharacterized protein n=1 Tax=Dyella telluris TaxID=2763498 RepID=A0A7G8Q2C3_9GAMM|nr:hypothetical protein [Dyella telluris]QNK00931.1 hypothetical protein H8F01_17930 [Dyella telluris]
MSPTRIVALVGIALLVAAILWMQHRQRRHDASLSAEHGHPVELSR